MNSLLPNFYQVCRLCLSELNGSCIPLFEDNSIPTDNEKVNYCVKIKFCFSITVEEKDNLPNALCTTCMRDVDKFYSFKETVIRNNAYLNSCTCNRIHRTGDQQCKEKSNEKALVSIQVKTEKEDDDKVNNVNSSDPIDRILQRTKGKIKVEMIPQVQDTSFDSAQSNGICDNNGIITNYEDRMSSTKGIKSEESIPCDTELDLTNKINNRLDNVSDSSVKYARSELLSPIHNGMISKSNDYSSINSSSIENTYYNLSTHSENFTDFESEDTKSVASDSYKDDLEDDQRLVIDEDCVVSEQADDRTEFSNHNDGDNPNNELKSEDCILLRTLTNSSGSSQYSMNGSSATRKLSTSSSSPSSIKNEIQQSVSMYKQESSPNHSTSPSRPNSSHYQGSTRRKQKCPTKSTDVVNEADENVQDSVATETLPIHQQIINISPVTVTCSSIPNDREEVIGFSQVQFLDEVLSRHSSPVTTPPIIPLQAERLHKACDVLLRAASKIQDLPINMEESIGNGSPPTAHYEEIENNKPLPLHSTNSNKKSKNKDKLQNNVAQHKECSNCHAIQTTIWRRDRFGNIVCNACGLYYKLHNFDRPCRMRRDEIHKRNRKRTPGEKGKKSKCNQNVSGINHSMTEQENSSSSYPGSCYETVITDVVYPVVENGVSSGKRRRRTSGSGSIKKSVNNRDEFIYYERDVPAQRSSSADSSSEIHHNGKKPLNDLYNHDKLKMITTAFQLSTHFMPINSSPTASLAANFSNSDSDDQIISEAPLNLAASGH